MNIHYTNFMDNAYVSCKISNIQIYRNILLLEDHASQPNLQKKETQILIDDAVNAKCSSVGRL